MSSIQGLTDARFYDLSKPVNNPWGGIEMNKDVLGRDNGIADVAKMFGGMFNPVYGPPSEPVVERRGLTGKEWNRRKKNLKAAKASKRRNRNK